MGKGFGVSRQYHQYQIDGLDDHGGMIMEEFGFKKGYNVVGRIGGLMKRKGEKELAAESGKSRLISLRMESVYEK